MTSQQQAIRRVGADDPSHIRVAAHDAPIPFSKPLEDYILPNEEKIVDAVRKVMEGVSVRT